MISKSLSLRANEVSEAISDLRLLRRPFGTPRNDIQKKKV